METEWVYMYIQPCEIGDYLQSKGTYKSWAEVNGQYHVLYQESVPEYMMTVEVFSF